MDQCDLMNLKTKEVNCYTIIEIENQEGKFGSEQKILEIWEK